MPVAPAPAPAPATAAPAQTVAEEFLRTAAADPAAAAARVTPAFHGLFFSDAALEGWLARQANGLTEFRVTSQRSSGGQTSLRGTARRGGQPVQVALRLAADAKVNRLLVTSAQVVGPATPPAGMEWPTEEALDFVQAFLTADPQDDFGLALTGMSEAGKAKLGPSDNARRQWLRPRRTGLVGGKVEPVRVTDQRAEFTGELAGPERKAKFTLKLSPGPGGSWLVDEFELTDG